MGQQSYVLLCSKITSFTPSEGEFSEKLGIFSQVKFFRNDQFSALSVLDLFGSGQAQRGKIIKKSHLNPYYVPKFLHPSLKYLISM